MKKLLIGLAMAAPLTLMAQNGEWCGTMKKFEEAVAKDPSLQVQFENLNNWIDENQQYIMSTSEGGTFVIPVVVHVIHNYGVEYISDAQIVDAINILNQDFGAYNSDTSVVVPAFKPIIGNTQFEFRLAKLDPSGNCTNGITRTVSTLTDEATDDAKVISWPRSKYYNMWIVRDIAEDEGSQGVTAGYAYFPGSAPSSAVDGILVQHNYVGSIGTSSGANFNKRVITHETGHFFSLLHPWGWGAINSTCNGSDGVNDTPPTRGSFSTCNLNQANCGELENVQNYMDYSSCTRMFTTGQSARMNIAINSNQGQRSNLWQNSNLLATGTSDGFVAQDCAPVVDFNSNYFSVCAGTTVTFTDYSWNATPTSWNWTFTNGTTTLNSTAAAPSMVFTDPGIYDVTLTVSAPGGNGTRTKSGLVHVFNSTAEENFYQYSDMFDSDPIVSERWAVPYAVTPAAGWEQTMQASYSAPNAVMVDNFGGETGMVYNLISPSYNFSEVPQPVVLSFRYAYAKRNGGSTDQLKVFVSSNCGQNWSLRATYTADDLVTASNQSSDWFPATTGLWSTKTISNLNAFYTKPNVRVRFEFTSGGGNNFFLDDINIAGPLGIEDAGKEDIGLNLYPNPASEQVNIRFTLDKSYPVQARLMDITGRVIQTWNKQEYPAGDNVIPVSLNSGTDTGIYLVEVTIGSKRYVERLIIE